MKIDKVTPLEAKKIQIEEFVQKTNKIRSARLDEEILRLNIANIDFNLGKLHIDVYV